MPFAVGSSRRGADLLVTSAFPAPGELAVGPVGPNEGFDTSLLERPPAGTAGLTVWLTGLPSAGKTTLGTALVRRLWAAGRRAELLDGDELRARFSRGLGFSRDDRAEHVRRVGLVAHLLSRNGVVAVCALVSPYRVDRDHVRALHAGRFVEVHVLAPVEVCAARDVKGLYAAQRAGRVTRLTGVDDAYEPPLHAEVMVPTSRLTVEQSMEVLWGAVAGRLSRSDR